MTFDQDTLLPYMRWIRAEQLTNTMKDNMESYETANALMRANGWVFEELFDEGIASINDLRINSEYVESTPEAGNEWDENRHREGGHFPRMIVPVQPFRDWALIGAANSWAVAQDLPYFQTVVGVRILAEKYVRYQVGLAIRLIALCIQHRCAKVLQNVLGLDDRGRPV